MKQHVLFVIADSSQTGAPLQVSYLVKGLLKDFEVSCICPTGWLSDELSKLGCALYDYPINQSTYGTVRRLRQLYSSIEPDIIHCHGVRAGIHGRFAARRQSAKILYTEHQWTADFHLPGKTRELLQLQTMRLVDRRTDHTIAVSEAVRDFLITANITEAEKTSVIYGGIEPLKPVKSVDKPVIGALGRLTYVKDTKSLIAALPMIIEKVPKIQCRIAGDGPDLPDLKKLAKKLKVADHIEWLGAVESPQSFFETLKIYVHPSLSESFGVAPLLALSAGLPVVATKVGALPEVITDQAGLLVEPQNPEQLAEAITSLLNDEKLASQLVKAGKEQVAQFSIESYLKKHRMLYRSLLAG